MDQIEEIKQKTNIVELINSFVPLKKAGRNFKGLCPFHSEKTPSFMVSPELQIFKCFGCGSGGDAIHFLQLYERMDFWEAAEFLAQKVGVKLKRRQFGPDEQLKRRLYDLHRTSADFYHFLLTRHSQGQLARDYLKNRGIKAKAIKAFKIGFSPLDLTAIAKFLLKKKFRREEILQAGLVFASRYQNNQLIDRFRGRVIFPLHDHRGNAIGFSGRLIPGLLKSEAQASKYINSPETPVYHKSKALFGLWLTKQAVKKNNRVVVVEGELDLISPWQIGIKNIVALKGTAFTTDQIRLLKRFSNQVVLALDEDVAGNAAALRGIQLAQNEGLEIQALDLKGKFKDPDEAVQKNPDFFRKAIKKTIPVWDFVIQTVIKKHKIGKKRLTINEKKKILAETLPFLAVISNEVEKEYYLRKMAKLLSVSEEAVLLEAQKSFQKTISSTVQFSSVLEEKAVSARREVIEGYLLGLILASSKTKKYLTRETSKFFKTFRWQRIFELALKFDKKKKFKPGDFLSFLSSELKKPFVEIFLKIQSQEVKDKEVDQVLQQLKRVSLKEAMEELSEAMSLAEKSGNKPRIKRLEKKFARLSRQLIEPGK